MENGERRGAVFGDLGGVLCGGDDLAKTGLVDGSDWAGNGGMGNIGFPGRRPEGDKDVFGFNHCDFSKISDKYKI